MSRTQEEILARIEQIKENDFFGFERNDLMDCLTYENCKQFLKPEYTEDKYTQAQCDKESVVEQMREYMPFAWEKANNKRGISASRSMSHFSAWVWLCGDDFGDLSDYEFYGKDNLVKICNHYGFDASQWDDGIRENE